MFRIDRFAFNDDTPNKISELHYGESSVGTNWPVAYIINNSKEAYVGETIHASQRASQHLKNEDRKKLTEIRIISDEEFNKSVILDLEAFLIRHMHADGKYNLQNGNDGLQDHEYYQRSKYSKEFEAIWEELKRLGVVQKTVKEIENSELYKYSPFKTLGEEQLEVEMQIIDALIQNHRSGKEAQ